MENQKIFIPVIALLVVVVGTSGFFGGMQYQKSQRQAPGDFQAIRGQLKSGELPQEFGRRLQQGQGQPVSGEIIYCDEESITVKLANGSSQIIFVGESVKINKSAPGTKDDLIEGTRVLVVGSENPDGSLNAASIQIGD